MTVGRDIRLIPIILASYTEKITSLGALSLIYESLFIMHWERDKTGMNVLEAELTKPQAHLCREQMHDCKDVTEWIPSFYPVVISVNRFYGY